MSFMLFTSFDEAWKGAEGPVGANWGIWRTNRTEKPAVAKVRSLNIVALRLPGRSLRLRNEVAGLGLDALGRLRTLGAAEARGASGTALPVWTVTAP
jgi:hypothetical protein